jgi:iron(III) transport system permease protein
VTNELTTTLLLAPIGTETLATQVWTHINTLDFAAAAPSAALMMAVSIPVTLLLTRRLGALGWEESR